MGLGPFHKAPMKSFPCIDIQTLYAPTASAACLEASMIFFDGPFKSRSEVAARPHV